jgi:hypothetical protein
MKPWSIAIAIVAGLAIVALLAWDSDGRDFGQRVAAEGSTRPAQDENNVAVIVGPERALVIILEQGQVPEEAQGILGEVRDLITNAERQEGREAQRTLEQAVDKLDEAIDQVDEAADDTENLSVKLRLELLKNRLESVRSLLEVRIAQL